MTNKTNYNELGNALINDGGLNGVVNYIGLTDRDEIDDPDYFKEGSVFLTFEYNDMIFVMDYTDSTPYGQALSLFKAIMTNVYDELDNE